MAPRAATAAKYVYLTFDDGPHPKYTAQILAILRRYGVWSTFNTRRVLTRVRSGSVVLMHLTVRYPW